MIGEREDEGIKIFESGLGSGVLFVIGWGKWVGVKGLRRGVKVLDLVR